MAAQVEIRKDEWVSVLDDFVLTAGYLESTKAYSNASLQYNLERLGSSGLQLNCSNPLNSVHLINSGLLPTDARLVTREQLGMATDRAVDLIGRGVVDVGLALKTDGDSYEPNDWPAKVLAGELARRGIELEDGKLIPLDVLKLREDGNQKYGAVFVLNDRATKDNILDLGDYQWYADKTNGLSVAYLNPAGFFCYNKKDLAESSKSSRIVVVSGDETARGITMRYAAKFGEERDAAIRQANQICNSRIGHLRVGLDRQ